MTINSFITTLKMIIFGTAANNNVTLITAPSYTSHNQEWKGAAPTLKRNATKMKRIPLNRNELPDAWERHIKDSNDVVPKNV
jgi:hypothetical protein